MPLRLKPCCHNLNRKNSSLTPNSSLSPLLGIGKNVICDRTATPLDAFRMMSAAQYYPKLLSIMGNVLRFLPAFVQMKELIEEGYVGELLVCEAQVRKCSTCIIMMGPKVFMIHHFSVGVSFDCYCVMIYQLNVF